MDSFTFLCVFHLSIIFNADPKSYLNHTSHLFNDLMISSAMVIQFCLSFSNIKMNVRLYSPIITQKSLQFSEHLEIGLFVGFTCYRFLYVFTVCS